MQYLLKSMFCLVVLTAGLATQAQAQLVTYHFTGTKSQGTDGIGNTISGSLTLDVGATPDFVYDLTPDYGCGEYAGWHDGGFSIDGITNAGFTAGTSFGGFTWTQFYVVDIPCDLFHSTELYNVSDNGIHYRVIQVYSYSYAATGDGLANVPNPWQPFADQYKFVNIYDYNYSTGVWEHDEFTLDTFTSTIVIAGCDTGIQDFVYNGKLVSQHLANCAAGAKNHGDYVSCVAKLTNALKKAGLLTAAQKDVIMSCAAKSNIGK